MQTLSPKEKTDDDACRMVLAIEQSIAAGDTTPAKKANKYALQIMGCFRASDFQDTETFAVALMAHLIRYPEAVVKMLACPLNGIPRTHKFCPSISEIADALEAHAKRVQTVAIAFRRDLKVRRDG